MKRFLYGFSRSKFLLWITITLSYFVTFLQPSCAYDAAEKQVVRGLCQAQCVSLCEHIQVDCKPSCLGPPGKSVIPSNTDWLVDCREQEKGSEYMDCVGTCSVIQYTVKGYIPAKPEVSAFLDSRSKNITLEWQPDFGVAPNTVYVVSMLEAGKQWQQIAIVQGGLYTVGHVQDICKLPSFRVAAVNRFGSRWFSNEAIVPANIPGRSRNVRLNQMVYDKHTSELIYSLQWHAPLGWDTDDIDTMHNVTTSIQCSAADIWDKVYVMVDGFTADKTTQKDGETGSFTMNGRVSVKAIGCTVIFKISARSRCNKHWIGPAQEFHMGLKCSDVMQYKGEYCKNPPVLRPGPVSQLKLTLIPLANGMMGLLSWQPPKDIGSAGKVEEYHIFYGVVDLQSMGLIKQFQGSPNHLVVSGDTFAVDIFLNITKLESYETVGAMVRAAGPGQIIESPFGDILYADNMNSLLHSKAGHLLTDDDTIIVVESSEIPTNNKESGIGVEIFWRRPNQETPLDIFSYALKLGTILSNHTSSMHGDDDGGDVFDPTSVTKMDTDGGVNFIRQDKLLPSTTYGLKIILLFEPMYSQDVSEAMWRNATLHTFTTPMISDENIPREVVTDPVNFVTHEKTEGKSTWTVLAIVVTTAIAVVLIVSLVYWRWHQRRVKGTPAATTPEERYRHYSQYGPGQSLEAELSEHTITGQRDAWELPVSSVRTGPMLGSGAFGKVVKGRVSKAVLEHRGVVRSLMQGGDLSLDQADRSHMSVTVAIKMLHDHCDSQHKRDFLKEIALMKRIGQHPHVVSMLGCCTARDPICLVVEHMANGDLLEYLKDIRHRITLTGPLPDHYLNGNPGSVTALNLLNFASQIVMGMEFLSTKGYVHRDLAARNVLVDSRHHCKIGDFGLTRYMYDDQVYINRKGGRLPVKWMSIEAIFDQSFSTSSDVWSFGIVLFEIVTLGGTPYPTIPSRDLLKELQSGYRMERPDNCSEELYQMMMQCWKHDPKLRPSFKALSDWLQGMLTDSSGLDYIDLGINLNRDVYQIEDNTEVDCIRYPLHRTDRNKLTVAAVHASGDRLAVHSEATSDDSGYTTSKKSSVSSGESGMPTPSLSGRRAENVDWLSLPSGVQHDDEILKNTEKNGCNENEVLKRKAVRKRVSFIDHDDMIDHADGDDGGGCDDDVFHDSIGLNINSPLRQRHTRASEKYSRDVHVEHIHRGCLNSSSKNILPECTSCPKLKRSCSESKLYIPKRDKKEIMFDTLHSWKTNNIEECFRNAQSSTPIDNCLIKQNKCDNRNDNKTRVSELTRQSVSDSDLIKYYYPKPTNCAINQVNPKNFEKHQVRSKIRTRKRKMAVVTPPTLALNNELYFTLDTSRFRQHPPAIKICRKIKPCAQKASLITSDEIDLYNESNNYENKHIVYKGKMKKLCGFKCSVKADVHDNPMLRESHKELTDSITNDGLQNYAHDQHNYSLDDDRENLFQNIPILTKQFKFQGKDLINNSDDENVEEEGTGFVRFGKSLNNYPHLGPKYDRKHRIRRSGNGNEQRIQDSILGDFQSITNFDDDGDVDVSCTIRKEKESYRVRNDSGVPRSPDDMSLSPGNGSDTARFFPYGIEMANDPSQLEQHLDGIVSFNLKPKCVQVSLSRRNSGSQKQGGCPALVSEKHPHALYNTGP